MSDYASCCVLSFNRPKFLRESLRTLVENAGAPFELIVHDDGSSDPEVYDLLWDLQNQGSISSLILNPLGHNQGQGVALNRMFQMATGDPIIKLDQDLVYHAGWLEQVQSILGENREWARKPTGAVSHVRMQQVQPRIGLLGLLHYYHEPVNSRRTKTADWGEWTEHTHILGSAFAVPRDCWRELGPFEEHSEAFAEDWTFQNAVTASDFVCALPDQDIVTNVGMGLDTSTVVVGHDKVQSIHKEPRVYGR